MKQWEYTEKRKKVEGKEIISRDGEWLRILKSKGWETTMLEG